MWSYHRGSVAFKNNKFTYSSRIKIIFLDRQYDCIVLVKYTCEFSFFSNRVSIIQQDTEISQWSYVPSTDNPTDFLSRGISPSQLCYHPLWQSGPEWFLEDCDYWPKLGNVCTEIPWRQNTTTVLPSKCGEHELFQRYYFLYRFQRILALCLRFINNCRQKCVKNCLKVLLAEITQATTYLLRQIQSDSFSAELCSLQTNKPLPKRSRLLSFSPFIGSDGLLRVGGRLTKLKDLPYSQRHQIILDSSDTLTKLIILDKHKRQLHSGAQTLLISLRQMYWILRGRLSVFIPVHLFLYQGGASRNC